MYFYSITSLKKQVSLWSKQVTKWQHFSSTKPAEKNWAAKFCNKNSMGGERGTKEFNSHSVSGFYDASSNNFIGIKTSLSAIILSQINFHHQRINQGLFLHMIKSSIYNYNYTQHLFANK